MSRIPMRARLTAVFVCATAAVLAALSFLLYDHLATSLDRSLDQALRARSTDVAALVRQADTGLRTAPGAGATGGSGFAQVITARGRILDETRGLGSHPLLDPSLLRAARTRAILVPRTRRLGTDVRLLAQAVQAQDQRLVIVVGSSLRERDQALRTLHRELFLGGPLALLAVGLIGYLVTAASLRPVERMRRRASAISDRDLGERLPVPAARDELSRLGTTLNEMLARIESGVARQRAFVADAAHELRTPLTLLRTEVELALDEQRDASELRAALESVGEEADRLGQLAEDLLLLARLEEGRLPLNEETIDVGELLANVAARFSRRAAAAGRPIEVEGSDARVRGDRLRLEQALGNLIQNALAHGGGTIHVDARTVGEVVELHVVDDGPGFAPGFASIAFERFSRAEQARSGSGTGLGLAIVKAISGAHGGDVRIEAVADGADVCLSVPTRPSLMTTAASTRTTSESTVASRGSRQ